MTITAVLISSCSGAISNKELKPGVNDFKLEEKPQTAELNKTAGDFAIKKFLPASNDANSSDTAHTYVNSIDTILLQSGGPQIDWDKKIIKTANVTLELNNYNDYNGNIHSRLKAYGAYVSAEQQSESDEKIGNEITIKVPVDKFDDLMNSLPGDGIKVLEKGISTEDVTGEVVDTKARIEAQKQVRAKYLELLKQAKSMDEILEVQNEINAIQEDIESSTGRIDYLVHSAAYSTINLHYYQYLNGVTAKDVEPTFVSKMVNALKKGGSIITELILLCVSVWPFFVVLFILLFLFKKLRQKKMAVLKAE